MLSKGLTLALWEVTIERAKCRSQVHLFTISHPPSFDLYLSIFGSFSCLRALLFQFSPIPQLSSISLLSTFIYTALYH